MELADDDRLLAGQESDDTFSYTLSWEVLVREWVRRDLEDVGLAFQRQAGK